MYLISFAFISDRMFYPAAEWSSPSSSSYLRFINDAFFFSWLYSIEWQGDVSNELERTEKEAAMANFIVPYIVLIFARRNWKTIKKKPRKNSHSPGSNLKTWLSEEEPHFRRVLVSRKKCPLASSLPSARSQASNRLPLEGFACKWA